MMKIAMCDDSRRDMEKTEQVLDALKEYALYDVYFSGRELLEHLDGHGEKYDIYIFDIEMPDMDGLELASLIRKKDAKALFVFLTSYQEYVMEVFQVVTFDYICKPVTVERLKAVLDKAVNYLQLVKRDLVFTYRRNQFRIVFDDILYIEKQGRRAIIHTGKENYATNMSTADLWEQLDEELFVHIHMSVVVNLAYISRIEKDDVHLKNGESFFVSRTYKQELKKKHMAYVRRMM